MDTLRTFSDEQSRLLVNLRQRYEAWVVTERARAALPYDLRRKTVGEYEYLYQIHDRSGNGKSLGRMDAAREAEFQKYRKQKAELKERGALLSANLAESAALHRALRLPLLSNDAGPERRSEEHTSALQSLMRTSSVVICLTKKNT